MKALFRKLRNKILFKDLPPPYQERAAESNEILQEANVPAQEIIDLLANCKITERDESVSFEVSKVEYAEIQDMGIWHSTPLSRRHKSKISLTWVLKENLDNTKLTADALQDELRIRNTVSDVDRYYRRNQKFNDNDRLRRSKPKKERVVGRNEFYHNLRFRRACEEFANGHNTCSDDTSIVEDRIRRKHRHRHRRRKKFQGGKFGYDIRDLDSFLTEATIDRPGNIPVVVATPSTLYAMRGLTPRALPLPLGTVVNAVCKRRQWLYAQTPHGDEGYVLYSSCMPLGILPTGTSQKKTPCWESSTDIYPAPSGNYTDNEKEQLRGRSQSESRCRVRNILKSNFCAEKDFDNLYLKSKSASFSIDRTEFKEIKNNATVKMQTLLLVTSDYEGSVLNRTLSVQKDDEVTLLDGGQDDIGWFYVRKRDGNQGYIPADVAGHGYI